MSVSTYIGISAQRAVEARLETIASNIANMNTAGFRAAGIRFTTEMKQVAGEDDVAFASTGTTYIIRQQGPTNYTGNDLDLAIDGDGWFGLQTPDGLVYTRDGRMHMTAEGELLSVGGYPLVDAGGAAIILDPSAGRVQIGENGNIIQGGQQLGQVGLFLIPPDAKLTRHDNSAVVADKPIEPVEDMTTNSIRQGYVEGSNVNPIIEMTRLVEASRAFDRATAAVTQDDETTREAIRVLGSS